MFALVALMLCSVGSVWGQTRDLVILTNTEENGTWNGSDAYTYNVPFTGIGTIKAVFSDITSASDRVNNCVKFKADTELNITAPSGYVIKYVKLDFYSNYDYHFNFAHDAYPYGNASSVEWTPKVGGDHENENKVRVANRYNAGQATSDMLISKITVRLHKAPTISISSDNPSRNVTLNEQVKMTPTVNGEIAVGNTGQPGIRWYLLNSADDTNCNDDNFLGWHDSFTFTPNTGVKKYGTDNVLKNGYGTYYIGARAQQQCIGTGGWEDSDVKVYSITAGVKVSANTYPAGLENNITIHQKDHPEWGIDNGDVVAQWTTAVFNAANLTGYTFLGWYQGDELLSTNNSYLYTKHSSEGNVLSDILVTAKYDGGRLPSGLEMVHQPIYGENHAGLAKEYITLAKLPSSYYNLTEAIPSSVSGSSLSGIGVLTSADHKNANYKNNLCYILGTDAYNVDSEKGLCISQHGKAGVQAGQIYAPTKATLAMKVAGTVDFYLLAKNYLETQSGQPYGHDRRHIKLWYKNDQSAELKPLICTNENTNDYYFYGERFEDNANGKPAPLSFGVRLQHLGKDGTCDIYITYESDEADDKVWIKSILVKRPDLKVTIGRTDKLYYTNGTPNNDNCKVTCFGEGQPYQWNFGTAGFKNTHPDDIEVKKVNQNDGRTYICGEGPNGENLWDHVLVYSDAQGAEKAEFDGRPSNGKHAGYEDDENDNNEHIEFNHPTAYTGNNAMGTLQNGFDKDRRSFTPILSNGLKVNVTGSGWFSIACSAPNGDVKMRIFSSTNGGVTYMNLLREIIVPKSASATTWDTYRVYLKAHLEKEGSDGFWDGDFRKEEYTENGEKKYRLPNNGDPEQTQMSIYVVFDAIGEESGYEEGHAQLNIHYMQWANELPADYVFQREEDPALLNSLQSIVSNGTKEKPGLYWQAGNDNMWEGQNASIPRQNTSLKDYPSSFDSGSQIQDEPIPGQDSGHGTASRALGGEWNVAADAKSVAHTEVAYKGGVTNYGDGDEKAYSLSQANGSVSDQNLEFAIPISGSFFRFMPMKNQFISTWIVPEAGKSTSIYVLDETGKPIPFCKGADTNGDNRNLIGQTAREHGWIHDATWPDGSASANPIVVDGTKALRIDFAALASKEYFIVTNGGKISLARLQATNNDWRANVEETTLTSLTDNANNSSAISTAMSGTGRYVKSVTLKRRFVAGTWASLVLPFSMNEKKLEEVFGAGTKCIHFTDVDIESNTVYLTHHFYNMIVAGRPVFIRPGKTVENPVIKDVTLLANTTTNTTTANGFQFVASYNGAAISKNDLYMTDNNRIQYLTAASATYPGLRSFIKSPSAYNPTKSTSSAKALFLNYDDEEEFTTGIDELIAEEFGEDVIVVTKSTKVYDLNGRMVAEGEDINSLPAGIYIVNGKKYIVK